MDDIKASAAKHHEDAAHQFDVAAKMHHEAAKQVGSGNFEKADRIATSADEAEAVADRHAMEALDLHRQHTQHLADQKVKAADEDAARAAKHESKASVDE